jgi:hypothetical protein
MQRVSVSSSNIKEVGWESGTLEVLFHGGVVGRYSGVPDGLYTQMLVADSVGKFFRQHIRDAYPYARVEQETAMATAAAADQPSHHAHAYAEFVDKVEALKDEALAHAKHPSPYSERYTFLAESLEEVLVDVRVQGGVK